MGRLDPTGVVKGWVVDEALAILRLAGARNVQIGAGGDLVAAGEPGAGPALADRDPASRTARPLAAVLEVPGPRRRDLGRLRARRAYPSIRTPVASRHGLRSLTVVGPR